MELKMRVLQQQEGESYKDYAYRVLKKNIMESYMAPGDIIDENELAELLHVSRMPIHEAVGKLSAENLVDVFPRKQTKVSKIDISAVNEGLFIRSVLEPAILKMLSQNIAPQSMQYFRANLNKQKSIIERKNDKVDFFWIDDEFHELLYKAANKTKTWNMMKQATVHLDRLRYLIGGMEEHDLLTPSYEDHEIMYKMLLFGIEPKQGIDKFYKRHIGQFQEYWTEIWKQYAEYFVFREIEEE